MGGSGKGALGAQEQKEVERKVWVGARGTYATANATKLIAHILETKKSILG